MRRLIFIYGKIGTFRIAVKYEKELYKSKMKLKYFGTGGGGGIPEIFCDCRICRHAREVGGREIRTRSQAVIDDRISIEFPVDTFLHTVYCGLDMRRINDVVITHGHYDHFLPQDLFSRPQGYTPPLRIYATKASAAKMCETIDAHEAAYASGKKIRTSNFRIEYHPVEVGVPFSVGEYTFTPLKARHAQGVESVIYVIDNTAEDKHILWAHDTGVFYPSVTEWLESYPHVFDLVSLDCTLGRGKLITTAHMDIGQCAEMKSVLEKIGVADAHTCFLLSHIGHLLERTHDELAAEASEFGMEPAYDGMEIIL